LAIVDRSQEGSDGDAGRRLPAPLEVRELTSGTERTLILAGELDLTGAGELENTLVSAAENVTRLTMDLSRLTFMDSTGLRLILFAHELCQKKGIEFALIPGPRQVQRVFQIAALHDRLPFQLEETD
jgi:anti-sigma B factor antagonist